METLRIQMNAIAGRFKPEDWLPISSYLVRSVAEAKGFIVSPDPLIIDQDLRQ